VLNKENEICESSESSYSNEKLGLDSPKVTIPEKILKRREIATLVHSKFMEVVETRETDPVVNDFNKGSVIVRRRVVNSESGINMFILERTDYGMSPADFLRVLQKVEYYSKANSNIKNIDLITVEDLGIEGMPPVEVYASYIKAPNAFIAGRIIFDSKYIFTNENLVIFTSKGNDEVAKDYLESRIHDVKGLAQGHTNVSGFKFYPIFDKSSPD
jgi:hypothetical protein